MNKDLNQNMVFDKLGMSFSTTSIKKGKPWLLWKQDIDFDLMLFYFIKQSMEILEAFF